MLWRAATRDQKTNRCAVTLYANEMKMQSTAQQIFLHQMMKKQQDKGDPWGGKQPCIIWNLNSRNMATVVKQCPTKMRITAIQSVQNEGNKSRELETVRTSQPRNVLGVLREKDEGIKTRSVLQLWARLWPHPGLMKNIKPVGAVCGDLCLYLVSGIFCVCVMLPVSSSFILNKTKAFIL